MDSAADLAVYLATPVLESLRPSANAHLLVAGDAAASLAEAWVHADPEGHATVVGTPSEIAAIRTQYRADQRVTLHAGSVLALPAVDADAVF